MEVTKYVVVITKDGFMTTKSSDLVLKTDEPVFSSTCPLSCNNWIHSIDD